MQHNNHASPSRAGSSSGHGRSPAPRAVPGIPNRQVETIDEEADEDGAGGSAQFGLAAAAAWIHGEHRPATLAVVGAQLVRRRGYDLHAAIADSHRHPQHSPATGAHAVQAEAAIQKQREQLLSLQSRLAAGGGGATGGCVDSWAVQYPLELEMWDGHSCAWKKKWGQCNEFAKHCAQTCGICTGPVARNRGGAAAGAPVSVVSEPAPQPQIVTESEEEDDPDLVEEVEDGDPDDELPAATPKQTTTPPAERPYRAATCSAASGCQRGGHCARRDRGGRRWACGRGCALCRWRAIAGGRRTAPQRVGGPQRPAPQKLAYGDEPDNSKSDNMTIPTKGRRAHPTRRRNRPH